MAKGLKTLIRLAKWAVDEKRKVLTALQAREEEMIAALDQHERQLAEEQRIAAADATGVGFVYGAYASAWLNRKAEMEMRLLNLRHQIEAARDDLAEAFRQQKTYEITQANREKRERAEAERKEQVRLDEIGLNVFRRREKEGE
jgi:flagellar export protein FliJ